MIKKNLLAIAVFLFSFILISNITFAQQDQKKNKTPEEIATKMADKMKTNLSLTDDQYKSVYNLFLQKVQDKQNNKEKYKSMDKESRNQMMKQNKENFRKQLEGVLNKDQITKLQEMKNKHKQNKGKNKTKRKKKRKKNNRIKAK